VVRKAERDPNRIRQQPNPHGIVEDLLLKLKLFWTLWGIDALICAIVAVFFILGVANGSVSSFNIGIWIAIWAALIGVLCGGLWLKVLGYPVWGAILLLILAIPGLLCGIFLVLLVTTNTTWN
jgi:hypothetical protein